MSKEDAKGLPPTAEPLAASGTFQNSATLDTLAGARLEEATRLTGEVIGGILEVGELLGKGGMGVVYQVFHREWNRQLAMKVPLALGDQEGFDLKRWVREAHTWIDLGLHPRVVSCWFVRQWKGVPILFLDLFSGGSLKERLEKRDGPPSTSEEWGQALTWLIHTCEGLQHAHSMGLVHRDIKPANLLFDSEGMLAVTDFGLGKAINKASEGFQGSTLDLLKNGPDLSQESSLTRTGVMSGTPHYAPPEQWMQKQVGPEADIYALAIVAYEILAGRHPFEPPGERWTLGQLISAHLMGVPPAPHTFNPQVPLTLSETLVKCLAKKAVDRPRTPGELRDILVAAFKESTGRDYAFGFPQPLSQRADALNNKAVSLWSIGLRDEALQAWSEADRLERNHLEVTYNRMVTSWLTGRKSAAEAEETIRNLSTVSARGRSAAGLFLLTRGKYQEAVGLLEESLSNVALTEDGTLWRGLGEARLAVGEVSGAQEAFEKALELIPTDQPSRASLERLQRDGAPPLEGLQSTSLWKVRGRLTDWLVTEDGRALLCLFGRNLVVTDTHGKELTALELPFTTTNAPRLLEKNGHVFVCEGQQAWAFTLDFQNGGCRLVGLAPWQHRIIGFVTGDSILVGDTTLQLRSRVDQSPCGPILLGHEKQVYCCEVFGQGLRLLTGGADRVVRLWNLRDGGCEVEGRGHHNFVSAMALGTQDQLFVSGDRSGSVILWHLPKMEKLHRFEFAGSVVRLILKGEGRDQTLFVVYRTEDETPKTAVVFLDRLQVVFERPGTYFDWGPGFGISDSRGFKLYGLPDGVEWRSLQRTDQEIAEARSHLGSNLAYLWTDQGELACYSLPRSLPEFPALPLVRANTLSEVQKARQQFANLMDAAWSCYRAEDWSESYWQLSRARLVEGYSREPETLELLTRLAKRLSRRELREMWKFRELNAPGGDRSNRMAIDFKGQWAATSSGHVIRLWDLRHGTCIRGLTGHREEVVSLHFWEDGVGFGPSPLLLSFGADRTVRMWNPNSGECLQQTPVAEHAIVCVGVHPPSRRFALVTRGGRLAVGQWQAQEPFDPVILATCEYEGIPHQVDITEDGKCVVVVEDKSRVFLFNEANSTLKPSKEFSHNIGLLLGRSHRFFGAHKDGYTEIVELPKGRSVGRMVDPVSRATSLTCSDDGLVVAGLDSQGTLRFWLVESSLCVLERPLGERLKRILFSGNGRYLAGLDENGTLLIWELEWQLDPSRLKVTVAEEEASEASGVWQRLVAFTQKWRGA